uniref:Putative microplusin 1 n=1 Tax=Amblyomma triste TaxID=251400 RepID=A0A023GCY0_AMBTT
MKAVILLAALCAIVYADHHEGHEGHEGHEDHHHGGHHDPHGSVCRLEDDVLRQVVTCVEGKVDEEVLGKLNRMRQQLECDSVFCGIKKFCQRDGTLENNRTDVFTTEQNQQLRQAFHDCRPAHTHSEESAHPAAEAAAPEA